MVRETRHLWVGNLPENIREDRIRDHFKRYGRVQSVKLLGGRGEKDELCATVSFMDIKSAAKAHHAEQKMDERVLTTEYHEPAAIPTPNYSRYNLGGEELSSSFDRSSHFYERGERGEGAGGYVRRSGYHSTGGSESLSRTRQRDRPAYRNGPYTPIIESVVSRSGSSGSHHGSSSRSAGGGSWSYESPSPRYPPSTPDISYPEPASILVHKKHSKSRHVNCRSGSDSGSNSSRSRSSSASSQSGSSTCSTASSSPTSEKSCSTHSQQSTLRSSGVQSSGTANHTSSGSPAVHSEDRRPLAICVRNLPARSSDTSLKDGLYHEYKKHGKVTWVKVVGQGVDRYALVSFKKPEDVDKALQVSHDKLFFGCKIEVAPYQGYDVDDNEFRPFEAEQDEFHPKATRTLFIGNLDKDITTQEIRKHFDQFGEIIDIDIKKQGTSSSYAFCQFSDIGSVVRAMRSLDGEHIGGNRVKLGFGKSMHTSCVWVDGVAESVSEKYLSQQFGQFGPVSHVAIDRARGQALVSYEQITYAQQAVKEMRGAVLRGRKLQVDYASRECQESFYDHMEKQSTASSHPPFENSTSVGSSPQQPVLRVFESPSSSTSVTQCSTSTPRYTNSCRYSGRGFQRGTSPSRSSRTRFQEYPTPSNQEYDRRPSYRSYEDVTQEENSVPPTGVGDIRHLQKERVSLLEQLEDCTSSGEEGTSRRRCNKHRRSASGEGSRPGTPLCDERPEGPVEPRRPRDSRPNEVISLPLPRFASQVLSPRPAPPSPPASPQTHSSSSDSEPSPEWEERLRSLDEKYEKWSGSRAGLTKPDPSCLKVRHKLLDLDLHELQPSEIVKSVLAKRSVFDEDSKRLENFGEKYEPREFVPARSSLLRGRLDLSPMSSPAVKSPSSPAAKGLQYPFPSHPPVQTGVPPPSTPQEMKPATTFLASCTPSRQFPPPKISSPQAEKCDPRTPTTKVPSLPSKVPTTTVLCKPVQEVKKDPVASHTKVKSTLPLRRESSEDKKEEVRRKSRDESVESVKSVDSVKRDDVSECDKVKDAQITERRKSVGEKRRSSSDVKDTCERSKDSSDKRRGSSEAESESKKGEKKLFDENHLDIPKPVHEAEKNRKVPNDSNERRKESESNVRHNIDIDKKKDVLGVNSEKDRRRNREGAESSDNPKHKKVPENKKELELVDKREKDDDVKNTDIDRKKENSESGSVQHLRHKDKKDHQERRRDSSEHSEKKIERISPENSEVHRIKEKKSTHDLIEPRNSKKHHDDNDVKCDNVKHKDSERRKNSENEISKEHSLFKKVFGFAERTYGHHKDRRDSDSTAVKTDDNIKHKRDHSEKERKKDKESEHSESSKHRSRKSPDQPENNRHKERKHSESSEKRSRKEYDLSDDHKQKDEHSESFHSKSHRKEDRSKECGKTLYPSDQEYSSVGKHERRKETSLEELRISESDSNDLKLKDGECKKDNEVFYDRRKEDVIDNRNKDERRRDSEKYFDSEKYNNDRIKKDDNDLFKDADKKGDQSEFVKFKHDRHSDRKKESLENCRTKDQKEDHLSKHKDDRKSDEIFDSLKSSKDDNFRYRDYSRRKEGETQDHIRIKDIIESKKKEEKKKERESDDFCFKKVRDPDDKTRIIEKSKHKKDFEINETKMNGDHDDYLDNMDCRKQSYDEEIRIDPIKKEKKKDRNNTWPATIGCKRRLSSQDSLDIVEDAKRSKPERRDSKDSGRSSGSSRKGSSEKHKGFTKLLEEKIKEDKEHEQRKKEELLLETSDKNDEKILKPAVRKEKRNSGEKRKEERKFKNRPRENGTASESDMASGDEEINKSNKRQQHSIFDIVDDEPAYISMYDKVKARSTKNMQKQEEEKRQEKLKEKFHQLKASRAKREEKKRSTSYDEDSDSEKGSSRRSNKLLITSSEDDACSESDIRIRSSRKILCDTSEDDTISAPRTHVSKFSEYDSKSSRKIISDISEDDTVIKHSTPKMKSARNISFESDLKTRKIVSDTSEDDSTRQNIPAIPRQKPSRIQSDESEGDLGFEDSIRAESGLMPIKQAPFLEPPLKIADVFASRPVEMNHFTSTDHEQKQNQLQSSPESVRRISLDSTASEQPRKKSHKKKQKKKNYEVSEDGTIIIRKHSSKKEKKKSHRDNDDDEKKSRKKKSERESSSNKRDEKYEDIFGPLSDDSEKAPLSKWQVSQVYGTDSESERENIRKKEKKRREKKQRELDEAGRALEAKLLDTSEDIIEEPVKTKKKKRKKSRDEKIKHHRINDEESASVVLSKDCDSPGEVKKIESEEVKDSEQEIKLGTDNEREEEDDDEDESKMVIDYEEHIHKEESSVVRQHSSSLSSLLDSPPAQQPIQLNKKPDIPGFGSEVDENIHETAVKSISESTLEEQATITQEKYEEKEKQDEQTPPEDKPTPVISQEETEDAVAALLMEDTFGSGFERYSEDTPKPDTPVSEPDLQIDTDTEDNFDQTDFSKQTLRESDEDQSTFYQPNDTREGLEERILPLACAESPSSKEPTTKPLEIEPSQLQPKEEQPFPKIEPDTFEESQVTEEENNLSSEKTIEELPKEIKTEEIDVDIKQEEPTKATENLTFNIENKSNITNAESISEDIKPVPKVEPVEPVCIVDTKPTPRINIVEPLSKVENKPASTSPVEPIPISESKKTEEPEIVEILDTDSDEASKNDFDVEQTIKPDVIKPTEIPPTKTEVIQQNVKLVPPEKISEPKSPVIQTTQPQIFQKAEKVVQHPGVPVNHTTVLVQQTLQQPQPAQIVKPLTIQVINHPPALKPLEQPITSKPNTVSPGCIKLSSPPSVLTSASQGGTSFQQKPQFPNQTPVSKPPIHHVPPFQGLKQTQIPHLVPAHLPVKPATQITLQTPQLTPISKGSPGPTSRPVVVHTIQNHSAQKQLHVVTSNPQISPQPLSPQNLKVIRPIQGQLNIRPPLSPQPIINRPPLAHAGSTSIPLLQTVSVSETSINKQFPVRPPLAKINQDSPTSHILHSTNQITQPEKVINLSPSQTIQTTPITFTQKTASVKPIDGKSLIHENNIDNHQSQDKNVNQHDNMTQKSVPQVAALPLIKPVIQTKNDDVPNENPISLKKPTNDEQTQNFTSSYEPKLIKPVDEPKPLNAVIQDLTLRAATKALGVKPSASSSVIPEIQCEAPKPLEQVVRELQLRKKASLPNEPEKSNSPKLDEPSKESQEISKNEPKVQKDENKEHEPPKIEVPRIEIKSPEGNKAEEPISEEVKLPNESPKLKEDLKPDKDEAPKTPTSENKTEPKVTPESRVPEPTTPKSHKDLEPESATPEERVSSEKTPVLSGSSRGRGGRPRGRRGRGGGGFGRGRGRGASTAPTHHPTPARQPTPADVYEFRDDSEEERPRLILTIKPEQTSASASTSTSTSASTSASTSTSTAVSATTSPASSAPLATSHNAPSTRKSRRLQEKDGSKSVAEEVEEVVRSSGRPSRRATRSTAPLLSVPTTVENTRKSPRRKQARERRSNDRSPTPTPQPTPSPQPASVSSQPASSPQPTSSPATQASALEPLAPLTTVTATPTVTTTSTATVTTTVTVNPTRAPSPVQQQKENQMSLQSPSVQPERDKELLPIQLQKEQVPPSKDALQQPKDVKTTIPPTIQQPPSQPTPPQQLQSQQKLQPQQPPLQKPVQQAVKLPAKLMVNKTDLKTIIPHSCGEGTIPARRLVDPVTGIMVAVREEEGQYVPMPGDGGEPPPEKRARLDESLSKTLVATVRPSVVRPPQQPLLAKSASPPHLPQKPVVSNPIPRPPKAHLLQAVAAECAKIITQPRPKLIPPQIQPIQAPKPPPTPLTPKAHILQAIGNAQAREGGIIGSPAPHQGSILTGSVASPPLRTHPQPIVTGASSGRFVMKGQSEPPGGRAGPEGGCIVVPTPSPQPPPRGQVMQAGLPVPAYEASLGEVVQHVNYPGHIQPAHYVHPQLMYQQYLREAALVPSAYHRPPEKVLERSGESNRRPFGGEGRFQARSSEMLAPSHRPRTSQSRAIKEAEEAVRGSPPLELSRRRGSPHDRTTDSPQVATLYGRTHLYPPLAHRPASSTRHQVATPPHASQVPPQADSLLVLLQRYPVMWQGLLALKNDQAAVQMHFVFGNPCVARDSLPCNSDGSTPPLRIAQRMRLEQTQLDGVARKMQMDNEHCMLLALPCGRDHMDVLQQSNNLQCGFITYLQQKQAAGIINVAAPGYQQAAYVVHIFPASEFANDSLARIAPDLLHRVTDIAHLLIVIATV